jgi:hypothetical protein
MIILDLLQNCRQSYQSIAKKNGVTLNAIKKRVQNYLDDGVIEFSLEPQLASFDGDWAMAIVTTQGTEDTERFINLLGEHSMINEVGALSGGGYIIFATYVGGRGYLSWPNFFELLTM